MGKKSVKPIGLMMTDSHLHANNTKDVEEIWRQAIEICKENGVNRIFHGGDVFTSRTAQPLNVLESMERSRKLLADNDILTDVIPGNHCLSDLESTYSYNQVFETEVYRVHEESYTEVIGDVVIHMLPYFPENGSYCDRLEKLKAKIVKGKFNLLITHIGINGGLAHDNASITKEVPSTAFKDFDKTLVGHFHTQNQVVGTEIYYTGSTHQQQFDGCTLKGFTLIYSDGSHKFIKSNMPEYHTISADIEKVDKKFLNKIKNEIEATGNKIRLIVTGDESALKKISKSEISDAGISKLVLKDQSVSLTREEKEASFVSYDKKEVLKEYKAFSVEQEIDPDLGLEYLEEIKG